MIIGNRSFEKGTHIFAIVNMTPDSFFAESRTKECEVLTKAEKMIKDGAAVLDIGAQSTRPGHTLVPPEVERERLLPAIRAVKRHFDIPVSVDTFYSSVARAALDEGADLINDIWGLQYDKDMAGTVAEYGASVCIMHNQSHNRYPQGLWQGIEDFLQVSLHLAKAAGIPENKIVLDGGIGFGKDKAQNFATLKEYTKLHSLGYPSLLGTSRKRMFGGEPQDRLPATMRTSAFAAREGILFVRVHDVKENKYAIDHSEEFDTDFSDLEG